MIIWLDLETTGLTPAKDRVLEVAAIATDDQFDELARFEMVTNEIKNTRFGDVDPFVVEMHSNNGLWIDSLRGIRCSTAWGRQAAPSDG